VEKNWVVFNDTDIKKEEGLPHPPHPSNLPPKINTIGIHCGGGHSALGFCYFYKKFRSL